MWWIWMVGRGELFEVGGRSGDSGQSRGFEWWKGENLEMGVRSGDRSQSDESKWWNRYTFEERIGTEETAKKQTGHAPSYQCCLHVFFSNIVKPRNNGPTNFLSYRNNFYYCKYRKLKKKDLFDQNLTFIICRFPLFLGPVWRGVTVPWLNIHLYKDVAFGLL